MGDISCPSKRCLEFYDVWWMIGLCRKCFSALNLTIICTKSFTCINTTFSVFFWNKILFLHNILNTPSLAAFNLIGQWLTDSASIYPLYSFPNAFISILWQVVLILILSVLSTEKQNSFNNQTWFTKKYDLCFKAAWLT